MKAVATKNFLDYDKIKLLAETQKPTEDRLSEILIKAEKLNGLTTAEAAELLAIEDRESIQKLLKTAAKVKNEITLPPAIAVKHFAG